MANSQLGDTEKVAYTVTALDGDSNPATLQTGDTLTVVSADTDSCTVVPDATPIAGTIGSGLLVGGKKVLAGLVITVTFTPADTTKLPMVVTDTIDIVGGTATSISFALGAPVSQ